MQTNQDFSDLESDLDAEVTKEDQAASIRAKHGETFLEAAAGFCCERCNGSGSVSGGTCYRCDGSGKQRRRPLDRSPEATSRRERARTRRQQQKTNQEDKAAAWQHDHADVMAWVTSRAERSSFARNLLEGVGRYGSLTEGQVAAVRRALADDEAYRIACLKKREAAVEAALASALPPTPENRLPQTGPAPLDLSRVPAGRYAVPGGETRLKVLIDRPEPPSRWSGFVFVSDAAEYGSRTKYGMQRPAESYRGKIIEELRIIAADPKAAAIAYGRLTGHCCICNRKLEDANSVAAGIGPVCAGRF